jgi:rubredoxin
MGEWECASCGHISDGHEPPATCPDCGAPKEKFVFYAYEDDEAWREEDMFLDDDDLDEDFDHELTLDNDAGS